MSGIRLGFERKVTPRRVANAVFVHYRDTGHPATRRDVARMLRCSRSPHLIAALSAAVREGWVAVVEGRTHNGLKVYLYSPLVDHFIR